MDPISIGLGVTGLAGQIFGGNKSAKANEAMANMVREKEQDNEAFYNNSVNRDFLETNAAKGILERIRKQYQDANQIADAKAVVTGATPEAVIAAKTANNQALNDATSRIAENATAYQDGKENVYRAEKSKIFDQKLGIEQNKSQNANNLMSNAGNLISAAALTGMGGTPLSKLFGGKGNPTAGLNQFGRTDGQGLQLDLIKNLGTKSILGHN